MLWCAGPSKRSSMADCSRAQIRDIGVQLFHAIEHVHSKGIIHTDIKPDNVSRVMHLSLLDRS